MVVCAVHLSRARASVASGVRVSEVGSHAKLRPRRSAGTGQKLERWTFLVPLPPSAALPSGLLLVAVEMMMMELAGAWSVVASPCAPCCLQALDY